MEEIVGIHVKLRDKKSDKPITGDELTVLFYDKDLLKDDFLGTSTLDDFGHASVSISRSDFRSNDSPFEKYPDIYFKVYKNGAVIYKSAVLKNVHIEEQDDFPASGALHFNLGTFNI